MSLEEKVYSDYIIALKAKDRKKSSFLSFLRSELKNQAINLKKQSLEDNEVLEVFKKQKKRLQDAKESMAGSGRDDLIEDLQQELQTICEYLPKPLDDSELVTIVEEIILSIGASSIKDMGRVMKEILSKVGVRADSKKVSILVKDRLSSN